MICAKFNFACSILSEESMEYNFHSDMEVNMQEFKGLTKALLGAAAALAVGVGATGAVAEGLPKSMVWSSYDLGSAGHTEATGMANALQTVYPTRIRIVPSGTSIGRMLPMVTGRVIYGFLGNEAFFSSEATFDFAAKRWGPQDVRVLMGRPSPLGMATSRCDDKGVKTVADLKGLKIGYVKGNPSVNVKNDAILAFAGLTRKDVEVVWFGGWGQQLPAILAGQIDVMSNVPTSGQVRQIEASPGGLCWPEMAADDTAGWERTQAVAGFLKPVMATAGAGLSKEKPKALAGYRYPILTTYARTSEDEVYTLMKALHATFDKYNTTTVASKGWAMDVGARPPYDAPTHAGAVRFLKEIGVWKPEDQSWNETRLARVAKVQAAWDEAVATFDDWRVVQKAAGVKINAKEAWPGYWADWRAKHL
jgi:TRAP transporter TAXI family solute receptor